MAEKKKSFQTTLLIVLGFAIVIAVAIFSISNSSGSKNETEVTVWGTFPRTTFIDATAAINDKSGDTGVIINYVQKDPLGYNSGLIEAFASGAGPDLFFLNQDMIIPYGNKISTLPYERFPERDFKLRYIDGASVFLNESGIMAFPFAVDPLVMYYNKSMFNTAGLANPPLNWAEFSSVIPLLTTLDDNQNILKSGLAFGQFGNIQYASSIFETLLLQLGNPIIVRDNIGNYTSVINESNSAATNPLVLSLQFFTSFSNPLLDTYSWNSSLQSAEDLFVQDRLALYFAPASRFFDIQRKNINLNYDIVRIPQVSQTSNFVTGADFYGIAVAKSSRKQAAAFAAANLLSNGQENNSIVTNNLLSPVRRDLLGSNSLLTPYQSAIRESALISYSWLNPGGGAVEAYLKEAVDSVVRGSLSDSSAASRVHNQLLLLLKTFNN